MNLLSYDEALSIVLQSAKPLEAVEVPIVEAHGRRLAEPIVSRIALPRFDNSQMDGYAVRSAELSDAAPLRPVLLNLRGTAPAGGRDVLDVAGGETVTIFTGAPIPRGADAVVPIEDVMASNDARTVAFQSPVACGAFVRKAGEDVQIGETVAQRGDLLTAGLLALASSTGHGLVNVTRQARVVILTNGDELASPMRSPQELMSGQIYESNGIMLAELSRSAGAAPVSLTAAADSKEEIIECLRSALRDFAPDLIIGTGGVSVGDRDFIRSAVQELGEILFWRAAIRPGKPIVYGRVGGCLFLGLPGNPASTLVTFELFARPLLRALHGGPGTTAFLSTTLAETLRHEPGRRSFVRAVTTVKNGGLSSISAGRQGSHYIASLRRANSLVVVPEDVSAIEAGTLVECLLTGPLAGDET